MEAGGRFGGVMIFYRTLEDLTEAAEAGQADAQYEIAMGHITGFCKGQVAEVDSARAYNWMMLAAEQGHAAAMENIGRMCLNGYIGISASHQQAPINRAAGLSWLQKALVAGAPGACRELGLYYRYEDPFKAAEYFYKAAYYFGDTLALRYYGEALLKGDGVDQDEEAGRKVLASALSMESGHDAEDTARMSDDYGFAITPVTDDEDRAARDKRAADYYLAALQRRAAAGEPAGQHELALRYYLGNGVAQDMAQARVWLEKSANGGFAPAIRQIETLQNRTRH